MRMWLRGKNPNTAWTYGMGGHIWSKWSFGLAVGRELAAAMPLSLYHSRWRDPLGPAVE